MRRSWLSRVETNAAASRRRPQLSQEEKARPRPGITAAAYRWGGLGGRRRYGDRCRRVGRQTPTVAHGKVAPTLCGAIPISRAEKRPRPCETASSRRVRWAAPLLRRRQPGYIRKFDLFAKIKFLVAGQFRPYFPTKSPRTPILLPQGLNTCEQVETKTSA